MKELDPEIAAFVERVPPGAFDFGSWTIESIPGNRAARAAAAPEPVLPPSTTVYCDLDEPVGMRVYSPPEPREGRPCLLWLHGGGHFMGSARIVDPRLQRWAEELDCVVVSVDYRLSPEHPYPAALDDCWTALQWCLATSNRVVVGGASAGGCLAAALALFARDRGERRIAAQLLLYPMLDDRELTPAKEREGVPVWDAAANRLGWRAYLGSTTDVPLYAAPARATDLTDLPPAFLAVGSVDLFRDEVVDYAVRLLQAHVPTELHVYSGGIHGFETLTKCALGDRFNRDIIDALRRFLRPPR